jgi:hypothetical protein
MRQGRLSQPRARGSREKEGVAMNAHATAPGTEATTRAPIKLFQFPRWFAIPNLSPFCCKLETWLRIAQIPYAVIDTPDPRKGPKRKLPFIEDAGVRIADSSLRAPASSPSSPWPERDHPRASINAASAIQRHGAC